VETAPILLIGLRRLENRLMHIWIKLLSRLTRIKSLQTMLLQCADQNAVSHLDAVVQGNEVGVSAVRVYLLGCNGVQCAVKVVDGLYQVACEALDGEVFCALDLAFCSLLEVAEVGY
jgi:hypothetical protein